MSEVEKIMLPVEYLDLVRYLCRLWNKTDTAIMTNTQWLDIFQYPVIQGTSNQINLIRIGSVSFNGQSAVEAAKHILGNGESRIGSDLIESHSGVPDLIRFMAETWVSQIKFINDYYFGEQDISKFNFVEDKELSALLQEIALLPFDTSRLGSVTRYLGRLTIEEK